MQSTTVHAAFRIASAVLAATLTLSPLAAEQDAPVFRSTTDLIAVDVQVVDAKGAPLLNLGAEQFEVTINRKRRRVVSVDLLRYDTGVAVGMPAPRPAGQPLVSMGELPGAGRTFMLAIDQISFKPSEMAELIATAREFVARLEPNDLVGLFAFPQGPQFLPTTDHSAVVSALLRVMGQRTPLTGGNRYGLTPANIVDLSSPQAEQRVMYQRDASSNEVRLLGEICSDVDEARAQCERNVMTEVRSLAMLYESETTQSLGTLREMLAELGRIPGRKTIVLLSSGILTGDRPGSRPDVDEIGKYIGQQAARTNSTVYSLFVDSRRMDSARASTSRPGRMSDDKARDSMIFSQSLSEVAATSGGALFTIAQGSGEGAFARVLQETSAAYLLAVEPDEVDRDGKPRALSVKIKAGARGTAVRARSWVVIPERK